MSSVVCQGLQSCLEPQPRVLRHKLSLPPKSKISQPLPCPQKPNLSQEHQLEKNSRNENEGNGCDDSNLKSSKNDGWNFIQALTNSSPNNTKQLTHQTEKVYVHPLVKRSASALSSKSLEMCTESLGSETGSDISSSSSGEFSSLSWEREKMQLPNEEFTSISWEKKSINRSDCREIFTKKLNPSRSFPPPLTSFSGLDGGGVQVRPHREGGRLVIKALAVSPSHTNFHADRANGRLRLSLLKECSVNSEIIKEKKEEVYNEQEEGDFKVLDRRNSNDLIEEEEIDEDDDDDDEGYWGEEMEGNGGNIGSGIGNGELARPSRCKESGRGSEGMSSWRPFRVAIS